jgi:hypothetical protein
MKRKMAPRPKSIKSAAGKKKIGKVLKEYSEGELHSGSKKGPLVKSKAQAIAIALNEGRRAIKK